MQQQRGIATVIQNHVGLLVAWPLKNLVGVFPVLNQALAFFSKNWCACSSNCGSSMVLSREDVARRPTYFSAQRLQGFDQHSRLNGHVQATCDAGAFEWFCFRELFAGGHQARHFCFSDLDFATTKVGKTDVGDDVVSKFFFNNVHG